MAMLHSDGIAAVPASYERCTGATLLVAAYRLDQRNPRPECETRRCFWNRFLQSQASACAA